MKWFAGLRELVYLRRSVRAQEATAAALTDLATILRAEYESAHPPKRKVTTTFDTLDIKEVNKRWREERTADMIEDDEDAANG